MSKFKVGDRVQTVKGKHPYMEIDGEKGVVVSAYVPGNRCNRGVVLVKFNDGYPLGFHEHEIQIVDEPRKILITHKGNITTARLLDGKKTIKAAEAKCAAGDTFSFDVGAALAFDRLIGRAKAVEPQDKPEPKDTTVERLELVSEICGMGMCRSASKRKNQCPIYGIRRERISCADYVIAHPETQKIMEDYLAAERAPEQPKGWNGEAICTADGNGCTADGNGFTVGKKYTFINGVVRDDDGDYRPCGGSEPLHSTSENWFANKFIEYRGEAK